MNNIPYLVRRRLLPPCSPEEHRRRRLTVLHAVLRCREKFGRSRIGARTTLYWSGEACQNYVMVKTNFVMVKTTCRPVDWRGDLFLFLFFLFWMVFIGNPRSETKMGGGDRSVLRSKPS